MNREREKGKAHESDGWTSTDKYVYIRALSHKLSIAPRLVGTGNSCFEGNASVGTKISRPWPS